ncbi:MAG: DUF2851 family protein [Dehalococcoidia bacterium]|nr:DUF2851 family protein [Dehalococcoidia bacterium]
MNEHELRRMWQERIWEEPLVTADGQRLEVVSTGIPGEAAGPDFRGAVLVIDGGRPVTGDVELHVKSSGWSEHGHNKDPAYNGVRLHVVGEDEPGYTLLLQNGCKIPTLVLLKSWDSIAPPCLDALKVIGGEELLRLLSQAGERRFLLRGREMLEAMRTTLPLEVLYQGIMEALGYSANSGSFKSLALKLPLATLLDYVGEGRIEETVTVFQGVLLGAAGLLPEHGPVDSAVFQIEWRRFLGEAPPRISAPAPAARSSGTAFSLSLAEACSDLSGAGNGFNSRFLVGEPGLASQRVRKARAGLLKEEEIAWELKVRPHNSPVRRLAGAGALLASHNNGGLVGYLAGLLFLEKRDAFEGFEKALEVKAAGYWKAHWDFDRALHGAAPALIGRGRARVIVVNIVLPFLWALGVAGGRPELTRPARDIYAAYPRSEDDRVIRHMQSKLGIIGLQSKGLRSVHQMGMHHLYRGRCVSGRCGECPVYKAVRHPGPLLNPRG